MYKNGFKKWVGIVFLLAVFVIVGVNSNVYAKVDVRVEGDLGPMTNINYGSETCEKARKKVNGLSNGNQMYDLFKTSLSVCFNSNDVKYNFSNETLEYVYNQLSDYFDEYGATEIVQQLPAIDSSYHKVEDPNLNKNNQYSDSYFNSSSSSMLTCDTKRENTIKKLYYEKKGVTGYYSKWEGSAEVDGNTVIYKTSSSKNLNTCETTCREELEVIYGPPKSVTASECFSYEVEIKSRVRCVAKINFDNAPKMEEFIPCPIKSRCVTETGNEVPGFPGQAGPNDDFDSCVNSCDGGKYTQSCINSCYNKVYGTSIKKSTKTTKKTTNSNLGLSIYATETLNKTLNTSNKYSANKVANNTKTCPSTLGTPDGDFIKKVYEYVNSNVTGVYSTDNNNNLYYTSTNGDCIWNNYGYYYFRTMAITARTVCNAMGYNWDTTTPNECAGTDYAACYNSETCFPGRRRAADGKYSVVYEPISGFKRQANCNETCSWLVEGDAVNNSSCNYYDKSTAEKAYKESFSRYMDSIKGCTTDAATLCDEENSHYTMEANPATKENSMACNSSNPDNCFKWSETHNKVSKETETSILKLIDGTCTNGSDIVNKYHTILTFPGAWVGNKHGEVLLKKPDDSLIKGYVEHKLQFCVPSNAHNVNTEWWTYEQKIDSKCLSETTKYTDFARTNQITYNILTNIEKFGHYNWYMDIGCFYAVNDNNVGLKTSKDDSTKIECNECTKCDNTPECPCDDDFGLENYTSKSISTTNMFPSTKTSTVSGDDTKATKLSYASKLAESSTTSSATRAKGFNWSVNATNLAVKGYPVTPSALINKIQDTSTYDEKEIDYDITLSTKGIAKIKSEANSNDFSYTSYDGKFTSINNGNRVAFVSSNMKEEEIPTFSYYRSNLIRNSSYISSGIVLPRDSGLSCNNLKDSSSCDIKLSGYVEKDQTLAKWLAANNV